MSDYLRWGTGMELRLEDIYTPATNPAMAALLLRTLAVFVRVLWVRALTRSIVFACRAAVAPPILLRQQNQEKHHGDRTHSKRARRSACPDRVRIHACVFANAIRFAKFHWHVERSACDDHRRLLCELVHGCRNRTPGCALGRSEK